jgi:hypothetical protein
MTQEKVRPSHYVRSGKDVWQMMIDVYGKEAFINFCEINAFKYRMRAGLKETESIVEDIEKAKWYENKANELRHDGE